MDPFTMAAASSVIKGATSYLTGKKKAPKFEAPPQYSVGDAASEATRINSQQFDANAALSTRTNDYNQSEATRLLEKAIPGFGAIQQKLMAQVNEDLSSTGLPADVQAQLQRFAAEKGITRGTSGGFNSFSMVKDFGFSMIDWQNAKRARALNTLSTVFNMAPRVNPTSPMSMFVSPSMTLNTQIANKDNVYAVNQRKNDITAGIANYNRALLGSSIMQTWGDLSSQKGKDTRSLADMRSAYENS